MPQRILAIETATHACSAALAIDGAIEERYALAPRQHAALILPMIESLLLEADIGVTHLDALAFGRGPGAFTGVRIAASLVQGIAWAADLPVVPVSTLAALALCGMRESRLPRALAALDARKQEVYWGVYEQDDAGLPRLAGSERVCAPEALQGPAQGDWCGVGSGWDSYAAPLMAAMGVRVVRVLPDFEPRAADVARIAIPACAQQQWVSPEQALPVYLRNDVAAVKQTL
jgi:tRNA threonylcarbamoyladenosine biosynthesis protein TsaB